MSMDPYRARGVSAAKEDVHEAVALLPPGPFPGAFARVVDDPSDDRFVHVLHADGAGTKSSLAYLMWRETGDSRWFAGIAEDAAIMNIDDMACIGVTDGFLLSNSIGRNAHRIPGEALAAIIAGYDELARRLAPHGVDLSLAGGETADVGDLVRTLIVDSTVYARHSRTRMIDASAIRPGDTIVGLASSGQASYEELENSGIGSNGLTLARHALLHPDYREAYPETYSDTLATDLAYAGPFLVNDRLPGSSLTIGEALLSPTRTYTPIIKAMLAGHRADIRGLIHCSGGGQTKCLRFGNGLHYVKDSLFDLPAIFRAIEEAGSIDRADMWRTFNMGHRMEVYCTAAVASALINISEEYGVAAREVGRVEPADGEASNRLTIVHDGQTHTYS